MHSLGKGYFFSDTPLLQSDRNDWLQRALNRFGVAYCFCIASMIAATWENRCPIMTPASEELFAGDHLVRQERGCLEFLEGRMFRSMENFRFLMRSLWGF